MEEREEKAGGDQGKFAAQQSKVMVEEMVLVEKR